MKPMEARLLAGHVLATGYVRLLLRHVDLFLLLRFDLGRLLHELHIVCRHGQLAGLFHEGGLLRSKGMAKERMDGLDGCHGMDLLVRVTANQLNGRQVDQEEDHEERPREEP